MARCYPDYGVGNIPTPSRAEQRVYVALQEQLPDSYVVFHSVAWISRLQSGEAADGETDFLIAHPELGLLAIEVKGGGVRVDYSTGQWSSVDAQGRDHAISNPFKQAVRGKHSILAKLREHPDWRRLGIGRIAVGHGVLLPDVTDGRRLRGPDAPAEILGDGSDISQIRRWIEGVFEHWRGSGAGLPEASGMLGPAGVDLVRRVFARVVEVRPLLSHSAAREEDERLRLTAEQVCVLDLLSRQRRVAVSGGAGTGKTLLAVEKAKRLAAEGFSTLLTCFNRPLADHMQSLCAGIEGLEVASFHQVCEVWAKAALGVKQDVLAQAKLHHPRGDHFALHLPTAFTLAVEVLTKRYDAVVVDEGQDFSDEFWLPLELSLADPDRSPLYVFFDENQAVYRLADGFPMNLSPVGLSKNCRNTTTIHMAAFRHYTGPITEPPPVAGAPIVRLADESMERQARAISRLVARLLTEEQFKPHDVVVLIADRARRSDYERALLKTALPSGVAWGTKSAVRGSVLIDTVVRFKGLEALAAVVWLGARAETLDGRETLYVGLSRARSILCVCGRQAALDEALGPRSSSR
jgi:hypothetical protein